MGSSPRIGIPTMSENQDRPGRQFNFAVNVLDGMLHMSVVDRDLSAAPVSVAKGKVYIVSGVPAGGDPWEGQGGKIARAFATDGGWKFLTLESGYRIYLEDEKVTLIHNGTDLRGEPFRYRAHVLTPDGTVDETLGNVTKRAKIVRATAVIKGSGGPDVTWNMTYGSDRSALGTDVWTVDKTTSSESTGDEFTSFDNDTLAADEHLWLDIISKSGTVDWFSMTVDLENY